MRDQILAFLAQGFSKADVLKTVGCAESLYEQIIQEETFVTDLAAKRTELQQERVERHYNKLEENTLKKLHDQLDFLEASQLCRVLETVARNKVAYRRPAQNLQNPTVHQSVTLILPNPAWNQSVILDSNSQVVSIGDRMMSPLPLQGVKDLFAKLEERKGVSNEQSISEASIA